MAPDNDASQAPRRREQLCASCGQAYQLSQRHRHGIDKRTGKPRCLAKRPDRAAHQELVLRACRWLKGTRRCSVVFAEMTTQSGPVPDAIGWRGSTCELVECKTSMSDLRVERHKLHQRDALSSFGNLRWFMVPLEICKDAHAHVTFYHPSWGLVGVSGRRVRVISEPPFCITQADGCNVEKALLVSAVRRHELGVSFDPTSFRFEPYHRARAERQAHPRGGSAEPGLTEDAPSAHQTDLAGSSGSPERS